MEEDKKEHQTMKEIYDSSVFGVGNKVLKSIWNKKRKLFILGAVIVVLLSNFLVGIVTEMGMSSRGEVNGINIFYAIPFGFTHPVFSLIIMLFLGYIVYRICWMFFRDVADYDENLNIEESTQKIQGSAEKMKEKEKEENFEIGDFSTITKIIYGADIDDPGKLYALKDDYGINHNVIIFGSPGAGKSRCYAIPAIMQSIRMGHSVIVTDPKLDLYNKTAAMLKANGYIVKNINLNPSRLLHSYSVDIMGTIGSSDILAQSFANTVLTNIYADDMDFWGDSEMNLLTAAVLFIPDNTNGYEKNIKGVYDFLNQNTVKSLATIIGQLPDDHPSKYPFNTFFNSDDTVKGNTLAGLQIHLSKLADKAVQKVLSTPDVDLSLPGKKRCAYFIGMSDQDHGLSWAVALLFTLIYQQLVLFADEQPDEHLPVTVEMILDEFYNIGRIPDFESKISTVRSRGINTHVILQSLAQLQVMYPDNLWDGVMECFHTWMLLRTNSMTTAKYFSDRSGQGTMRAKGKRYSEMHGDPYHAHMEDLISESDTGRPIYYPDEILRMNKKNLLVYLGGTNPIEMKKIDYSEHPMCKEIRKVNGAHHLPGWVEDLSDAEFKALHIDPSDYDIHEFDQHIEKCTREDFEERWTKEKEEALQKKIKGESKEQVEEEYSHADDEMPEYDPRKDPDKVNHMDRYVKQQSDYQKKMKQYRKDQANGKVSDFVHQNDRMKYIGKGALPMPEVREEKQQQALSDEEAYIASKAAGPEFNGRHGRHDSYDDYYAGMQDNGTIGHLFDE